MNEYVKQAEDFLKETNTELTVEFLRNGKYFHSDKDVRDIYKFTIKRGGRTYSSEFGQSVMNSQSGVPPTAYDILACLTKYDPGTFEDFCSEFGYDEDSRNAEKTYNAVREEWMGVQTIWTDEEIDKLLEIQ